MSGFRVEYDSDSQVCIIPMPTIPANDLIEIMHAYMRLGYKYWLLPDQRRGYILSKEDKE